jgi:thiol-disulfide isomerase/thioredoxin
LQLEVHAVNRTVPFFVVIALLLPLVLDGTADDKAQPKDKAKPKAPPKEKPPANDTTPTKDPSTDIFEYKLSELPGLLEKNRGSVVVFHLYASWCPPCRDEFPDVIRVTERYKNQPFKMLAFSADQNPNDLKLFLQDKEPLGFEKARMTLDDRTKFEALGMKYRNAIPYTALFDATGKVVDQWSGSRPYAVYCDHLDKIYLSSVPGPSDTAPPPTPVNKTVPPVAKTTEPAAPTSVDKAPSASGSSTWVWWLLAVGMIGSVGLLIGFKSYRRS